MPRKYPPLNPDEVVCILRARGFDYDHSRGSHEYYKGMTRGVHRMVTVDLHYREFVSSQVLWDFAGSRCWSPQLVGGRHATPPTSWGLRLATHANSQRPRKSNVKANLFVIDLSGLGDLLITCCSRYPTQAFGLRLLAPMNS